MKETKGPIRRGSIWLSLLISSILIISTPAGPVIGADGSGLSFCSTGLLDGDGTVDRLDHNFSEYMDYEQMTAFLQSLAKTNPDLMRLSSIGRSYEGKDIWCVKLSDSPALEDDGRPGSEPDALLVGAHHGNEWISYEAPLYVISFLLENYGGEGRNGSASTYILENREVYIVPMLNPDGTQYSHLTGQGWRKNREPNYLSDFGPLDGPEMGIYPASYGVDINRNYGWMWHESGGSNALSQSGGSYRGPPDNHDDDGDARLPVDWRPGLTTLGPEDGLDEDPWDGIDNDRDGKVDEDPSGGFSSAETVAMRELGDKHHFPVMITYHSFSELVLWPWGYTLDPTSDDAIFTTLGTRLASMNGYTPMQGYELYKTTGEMTDWFYAMYGTFAFTYEIGTMYRPPEGEILSECQRNLWSTLYLCHAAQNVNESYLDFRTNASTMRILKDRLMVDIGMVDDGYPIDLDMDACVLVYRKDGGSWRSVKAMLDEGGNWTASVPIDAYTRDVQFYLRVQDVEGNVLTEPLYAPYEYLVISIERGEHEYPYFTLGTFLIMVGSLGIVWGGFGAGIFWSLTADRRRAGSVEL